MTDTTETTFVDMTSFLEGHERRTRRVFLAMMPISLVLAAIIFAHALTTGAPGIALAKALVPIMAPFTIAALRIGGVLYGRQRPAPPGGRFLMNGDDARNVARVANAGGVFVTGVGMVLIAVQVFWALQIFGILQSLDMNAGWIMRIVLLAFGVLSIYLGNVWPRMPTPRAPDHYPAAHIKIYRLSGWLTVICGLLLALAALLPLSAAAPVAAAAGILIIAGTVAGAVRFHLATRKSRRV